MKNYVNYHKHTHYSNIITPDSAVTNMDYANRVIELGQTTLSGLEHGYQGNYIETYEIAKEKGLKFLFGVEAYIVKDRLAEIDGKRDATNAHIVLLAKNETGRKGINRILSQANIDGYYYKPRIDIGLLLSLDKDSVWASSACLGGIWKYEDYEEIIKIIHGHFGDNFFLEVQAHHTPQQVELNKKIINISNRENIKIVAGMDSHYIYPEQAKDRDDFLLSKNIRYEDEEGWFLDFPSYQDVFERFVRQGALTKTQIEEALENTLIFEQVEEYNSPVFGKEVKLPTIYPQKTQEERNKVLSDLVYSKWDEEKVNIPKNKWAKYEEEIAKELETVIDTGMADYFLINYEVIKRGIELGGHITKTSRGSSSGFYTSKLLGFTTVDRIASEVKLFPERFITKERILESGSLPDIDMNLGNPEVFAQAQKDVLGDDHSYPMMAYGTAKPKAAWKIYARAQKVDFAIANDVSKDIERYEMAMKHADDEEERTDIDVLTYIRPEYRQMYEESTKYQGTVSDAKIAPCAHIIFDRPITEEIGLIRLKENVCAVMDGSWAEKYHFLKNDLLKVSVVELIHRVYKRVGIEPHSLPELIKLCNNNTKVWDVYRNGWTMGINQLEQDSTRGRVAKYAPTNISELSAFIAAIRPGFKSYYSQFEARNPFEYGIETLDNLIQTKQFPYSYMLYQENAMQVLAYSGIKISETYDIIKNIAKKRAEKVYEYKDKFISGMKNRLMKKENLDDRKSTVVADNTWQVIEDSANYSFNACFAGDTVIQKYLKRKGQGLTLEQMFLIKNYRDYAIETEQLPLHEEYAEYGYGTALSMFPDGKIRENQIVDIRYEGKRKTYRVMTENGAYAIATDNHKFPTEDGDKTLSELSVGDYLYVRGISDGRMGIELEKIISITYTGIVAVYDVEMADPAHNVITKSGLVASNSHAYSMAGDSLYGAYLKSHYPLEFYETLLRICEEDGDKDRLVKAKDEARHAYKINFPPYRFGQDNREISLDKETNSITSSLQSIKSFGKKNGEDMWEVAQEEFNDFVDLLIYCEDNGCLYSYFEKLIDIQYFDKFGGNKKLHKFYDEFVSGKSRYKKTHTEKTKSKRLEELREIWENMPNESFSLSTQLDLENEILGNIQARYNVPKDYLYVLSVDTKFAPRAETYCLASGKVNSLKIRKKVYDNNIFYGGEIIKLDLSRRSDGSLMFFQKEPRRKFENGQFVDDPNSFEWWTYRYEVVSPDDFDKLVEEKNSG